MVLTPLNDHDSSLFKNSVRELKKKLQSPKAKKFFADREIPYEDVINGLDKLQPFDGVRSNMPVNLCGIIKSDIAVPLSQYIVKRFPKINVCVGINREETRFNLYFFGKAGLKPCHILHELLHSVTGLGDVDLANKLRFQYPKGYTLEISYFLERECL